MEEKGKKLGLINLLGLGLGGVIGSGIFVMLGFGIALTGRSIVLVCAVGCFFMLLAFWYNMAMSTMFVFKSGDYGMRTMLFNPLMTGINAWFTIISAFSLSTHSLAIMDYAAIAMPALEPYKRLCAFIILTVAFIATARGSSFITRLQNAVTALLVIALIMFVVFGFGKVDPAAFFSNADGGFWVNGLSGFTGSIAIMSFACMGATGGVAMAAVTENPKRNIPLSIIMVTAIVAVVYGLMAYVASGILPYEQIAGVNLSVTAEAIMPHGAFLFFVVGGGVCAIASTLLGNLPIFRYPILQIANDGWLPAAFKKTDKNGFPYVSYLVLYAVSAFPIISGMSIDVIVSDIMIPTMLMNAFMNFKCLNLPEKYPEQWEKRSIRMPLWAWKAGSLIGCASALLVVYNLFKNLATKDAVICVIIVVVLVSLSLIRLKQGAVKTENLEKARQEIIAEALNS